MADELQVINIDELPELFNPADLLDNDALVINRNGINTFKFKFSVLVQRFKGGDVAEVLFEYSVDGTGAWTSSYIDGTHYYMRISSDNGTTWSNSIKIAVDVTNSANWDTAFANTHTHSNKVLLDTYTQTELDIADAISKEHTHSNKVQLDLVTDGDHDIRTDNPHGVDLADLGYTVVTEVSPTPSDTNLVTEQAIVEAISSVEILTPTGTSAAINILHKNYTILNTSSAIPGSITLTFNNLIGGLTTLIEVVHGATARDLVFPVGTVQVGALGNIVTPSGVSQTDLIAVAYNGINLVISKSENIG